MYLDHNENLRGQIVLINSSIHEKANLRKEEFLERIEYIKAIRTSYNNYYISFYITSIYENNNLIKFHDLVNKGIFHFDRYYVFAVAIQPKLYNWFKTTDITTIQKQIASWLAGTYYFNPHKRDILKRQIYKPLFEEVLEIVNTYYKGFPLPEFTTLKKKPFDNVAKTIIATIFANKNKWKVKYLEVCKEYYKTEPPEFLSSPIDYDYLKEWGVNNDYNFEFVQAYFNEEDWDSIIVKGDSQDKLLRQESLDNLWLKWKHVYSTFHQRKNFVYSFYLEPIGTTNKIEKKKRKTIQQDVKNKVWQRDLGKCVKCGSEENLEFDHIIPFSKGGSSTYRNIQLLCEPCNRKKNTNL